jgi:hypothetical protein
MRKIISRADKPAAHGQHGPPPRLQPAGGGWRGQAIERAARAAKNARFEENRKGDVPVSEVTGG